MQIDREIEWDLVSCITKLVRKWGVASIPCSSGRPLRCKKKEG